MFIQGPSGEDGTTLLFLLVCQARLVNHSRINCMHFTNGLTVDYGCLPTELGILAQNKEKILSSATP
jgi:hypothetical protein